MKLNGIKDNDGARKSRMRVGRGIGSTKGKTAGRGHKGQKARTGVSLNNFEGGQMPIYRRLPKRGFVNVLRVEYQVVNTGCIQKAIAGGKLNIKETVTVETLVSAGLLRSTKAKVKLLAKGDLNTSVTLHVDAASVAAQEAVQKAGGKVILSQQAA